MSENIGHVDSGVLIIKHLRQNSVMELNITGDQLMSPTD